MSNSTDPGPEFWRRQAAQLAVIGAMEDLIDREPDRFTGLTAAGSGHVTLHVTDLAVLEDARLVMLLQDARAVRIDVGHCEVPRSLRELRALYDEILRTDPFRAHGVDAAEFRIDPATATVRILVADSAVDLVRRVFARHGDAVAVVGNGRPSCRRGCAGTRAPATAGPSRPSPRTRRRADPPRRSPRSTAARGSRSRCTTSRARTCSTPTCAPTASGCSSPTGASSTRPRPEPVGQRASRSVRT